VDSCAGGTFLMNSVSNIAAALDLNRDGTIDTTFPLLQFVGTTSVFLGPGSIQTIPHSMPAEIYDMTEINPQTGAILRAGDGVPNTFPDGSLFSPGNIVERAGVPSLADSFFDVFFELDIPLPGVGRMVLRNRDTLIVECQGLTQVPLNGTCDYNVISQLPLDLYEGGVFRGQLLATPPGVPATSVSPVPEPVSIWLIVGGLAAVAAFQRRRATCR